MIDAPLLVPLWHLEDDMLGSRTARDGGREWSQP